MKIQKNEIIEVIVESYAFEGKGVGFIKDISTAKTLVEAATAKTTIDGQQSAGNPTVEAPTGETPTLSPATHNPGLNNGLNAPEATSDRGFVVFVQGAYPGEKVRAKVKKVKKNYAESVLTEVLIPSPHRIKPECRHFGVCGGCKQQDLVYPEQVAHKQAQVADIFKKIGGIENFPQEPLAASDKQYYYRNKMEFSFSQKRWLTQEEAGNRDVTNLGLFLGLHVPGVYDKVLDLQECKLQSPLSEEIMIFTREYFIEKGMDAYSTKTHTGYLRNLVIRQSENTDDLMVNLVTSRDEQAVAYNYASVLTQKFPEVTTVVNNINTSKAQVAKGEYEIVVLGSGKIYDKIGDYKFGISANSFFQTNTLQAEKLYYIALEYAGLRGNEVVFDLYCGAGTITIFMASHCREIYGFEAVPDAIMDAETNKNLNNAPNAHFFMADLYKSFLPVVAERKLQKPDVVVLDPPRSGLHPNTLSDVISLSPAKIVYVSCNPATQARDVKEFLETGYRLVKSRAVDMFPNTWHIENVVLLVK